MDKNYQVSWKERGQLSIFLGLTLLIVLTLLAFIINVGLFVKAKINLQNAVDAAAWSGASVQARQLSNISYLNWEMRNTYKEWMFKYYVLGQLGLRKIRLANLQGSRVNFRLEPFYRSGDAEYDPNVFDPYNLPSICIHYGSPHNICEIYSIPGLPRFETVGLPSISEHHEAFLNSIVATKANDCSTRSNLNFGTAMIWAYGTKTNLFANIPQVAAQRVGAWPQALELGLRMRNLEMMVNRPPVDRPICLTQQGSDCTPVSELDNEQGAFPLNERPIKAFWSAYRNISGGKHKESGNEDEFARSFRLTEIAPNPVQVEPKSVSGFLIPPNVSIGQSGVSALTKYYLDLQAYPLNLVNFFTTFVSSTGSFGNQGTVKSEADCGATKTALPVPGYIFGFTKNPEVLTYYTVKGEANFVGMFFPFTQLEGIKLTAYASAKPFGGRIGPRLFDFGTNNQTVLPRDENLQFRSAAYASGLRIRNETSGTTFKRGYPIPHKSNFWVETRENIGGVPGSSADIRFAIPNLLYDFDSLGDLSGQHGPEKILALDKAINIVESRNTQENKGLYDRKQFEKFANNLPQSGGQLILNRQEIETAIEKARAATKYEALNYLIPTPAYDPKNNPSNLETLPPLVLSSSQSVGGHPYYNLFAPLYGQGTLYPDLATIQGIVQGYIIQNQPAIDQFIAALKDVADSIRSQQTRGGSQSQNTYVKAANSIYNANDNNCDSLSMAGKFQTFFQGPERCGIKPLPILMAEYIDESAKPPLSDPGRPFDLYYRSTYVQNSGLNNELLHTAYMPGPRQGAQADGTVDHPFGLGGTPTKAKRNFYSTKFVATEKLIDDSYSKISPYLESTSGSLLDRPSDLKDIRTRNLLAPGQLSSFGTLNY